MEKDEALSNLKQIKQYLKGNITKGHYKYCLEDASKIIGDLFGDESSHYKVIRDAAKLSSGIEVGILLKELDLTIKEIESTPSINAIRKSQIDSQTVAGKEGVFIVHGRDNDAKEQIASFIKELGLKPIILHEQPNEGRTIIEKFEHHSSVEYAVVLLTPDDIGGLQSDPDNRCPRARQNVIFEMGCFFGKLGRSRVCALISPGVEQPSDLGGIVYIPLDQKDEWKPLLKRELNAAGIKFK